MFLETASSRRIDSMESGFDSDDMPVAAPTWTAKRKFAVGAGLLGLAGCAVGALHLSAPSQPAVQPELVGAVSARGLLEHPDFIDVAAQNVWTLAGDHLQGKEHQLKPAMHRMMRKLTDILSEHDPEGREQLENIKLSPDQKADVLTMVKKMGDKRVQGLGREVLEIGLKHKDDDEEGIKSIQKDISSKFQPRVEELKTLRSSIVPASIRDLEDKFNVDVSVQSRRLTDTSTSNPGGMLTAKDAKAADMKMEDALGIVGGLLEQARLALDESAVIGGSFGSDKHVPAFWRSLIGLAAFGTETADCFMRQNDAHAPSGKIVSGEARTNTVKAAMCPMKYAGAGMDFLSGINNVMNIQNTKLPQDFGLVFGGHAQPQAAQTGFNPQYTQQMFQQHQAALQQHAQQLYQQHAGQVAQPTSTQMTHMANMAHGLMSQMAQHGANQYAQAQTQHPGFTYTR